MLKTQHPTDYLKKEEIAEPLKETEQIKRLPKLKRYRRSDSPDYEDEITPEEELINTIKNSDSAEEKLGKIRRLLEKNPNINFQEGQNNDTPLHIAIRKQELKIIELLIANGADTNIKNKRGKTPLDIAKQSNKQEITDILTSQKANLLQATKESNMEQESLVDNSRLGASSHVGSQNREEEIEQNQQFNRRQETSGISNQLGTFGLEKKIGDKEHLIDVRLHMFIKSFVKEFEKKLTDYHEEVKPGVQTKKAGKVGEGVAQATKGASVIPIVGKPVAAVASVPVLYLAKRIHRGKAKKIDASTAPFQNNQESKEKLREISAEASFYIFKSFESQFTKVTDADGNNVRAIGKLAEDAANRVINYIKASKEKIEISSDFITEGVILGKSKEGMGATLIPKFIQNSNIPLVPKSGHTVKKDEFSGKKWKTSELYEKTGLVKTESNNVLYYQKKGNNAKKYGYRLLLQWESEKWGKELRQEYKIDERPLTDEKYDYVLDLLNSEQAIQKWSSILEEINKENPTYRIEKGVEKGNEGIDRIEDKVDETKQIVEEGFGDNKKEHEKTQAGIENANQGINALQQTFSKMIEVPNNKQIKEPVWFDVRDSVTFFTALSPGREDQLNKIADNIQQKIIVITGESGVGKSELAIQYARSKYSQGSAIWINAKTREAAEDSFSTLAKDKLKISLKDVDGGKKTIKSIVQDVYEYFADQKSLFIFDNAEKYTAVAEFLPLYLPPNADKPWILITSTNSQKSEWESPRVEVEVLKLNSFDRSEAIEFVKKALRIQGDSQNEDIIKLAEKLYDFPLLLEYATVEIKDYQKSNAEFKIINYVKSLDFESTLHIDMLAKILKVRVDKIKQKENGQEALEIFNIMAYFASGRVQEEIFLELVNNDRIRLEDTIHLLIEHSVVKQGSMHELVKQVIRSKLKNQQDGLEEKTLEKALNLLKERMKSLDSVEHYIPHIISIWNHASKYDKLVENFIVNAVDTESAYTTYLHLIVEGSSNEVVSAIFDKIGTDKLEQIIKVKRQDQKTLLHCAAIGGNEQTVRLLIDKGATADVVDKLKNTPLHLAAKNGYLEVVNFLLGRESNVNDKTQYGFTPLHLAAKNGHLKIVEALLGKRADVIAATNRGFTALHFAADNKQEEIIDVLLDLDEVKTNINSKTRHEYTSLHLAAKNGHIGIVNKLLAKGASVDANTRYKFTPLHLAAKHGHKDVILTLIENGADVNAKDQNNFTPLHLAVQSGDLESVNALLGKSALINAETKYKFTPLHLAIQNNHKDIVEILLNREADINAQTTKGNTALHLAAENGNLEVVKALIAKNADIIDVENEEGKKALDLAVKMNNLEVKDYIRQQTFNRRQGTSGISGQLYEIQLLMLFLLKGPEKTSGFHLATNVKEAGDFDDVVFKYKDQGGVEKTRIIFLQAKHRDNTEKDKITVEKLFSESEKGDFNLKKYFNSYRKIKQQFSEEGVDTIFKSRFEDSDFIIYTNALPNFGESDKGVEKIAVGQEDILNLEESRHYYKLSLDGKVNNKKIDTLLYASDCKKLARELVNSIFSDKELDINEGILRDYHIPLADKVIEKKEGKGKLRDSFLNNEDDQFRNTFFEEVRKGGKFTKRSENELKSELKSISIELPKNFVRSRNF